MVTARGCQAYSHHPASPLLAPAPPNGSSAQCPRSPAQHNTHSMTQHSTAHHDAPHLFTSMKISKPSCHSDPSYGALFEAAAGTSGQGSLNALQVFSAPQVESRGAWVGWVSTSLPSSPTGLAVCTVLAAPHQMCVALPAPPFQGSSCQAQGRAGRGSCAHLVHVSTKAPRPPLAHSPCSSSQALMDSTHLDPPAVPGPDP